MTLDCIICQEACDFLKILSCFRHALCVQCIEKLNKKRNGEYFIVCPFDYEETEFENVDELRTKFSAQLRCDDCSEMFFLDKCCWCQTCVKTSCSCCCIKFHRDHSFNFWDNFDILKDYLYLFQQFAASELGTSESTLNVCMKFNEKLKSKALFTLGCKNLIECITTVFGKDHLSAAKGNVCNEIKKPEKLKHGIDAIFLIVRSFDKNIELPDSELMADGITKSGYFSLLHMVENIIDSAYPNQIKMTVRTKFFEPKSDIIIYPKKYLNFSFPFKSCGRHTRLWKRKADVDRLNVKAVCACPKGFVIVDDIGISVYEVGKYEIVCIRTTLFSESSPLRSLKTVISFCGKNNKLVLCNDGKLLEYDFKSVVLERSFRVPLCPGPITQYITCHKSHNECPTNRSTQSKYSSYCDDDQYSFVILSDGRYIYISAKSKKLFIWIYFSKTLEHWKRVWKSRDDEYTDCVSAHVIPAKDDNNDYVFIACDEKVVKFMITENSTQLLLSAKHSSSFEKCFSHAGELVLIEFPDEVDEADDKSTDSEDIFANEVQYNNNYDDNADGPAGKYLITSNFEAKCIFLFDTSRSKRIEFFVIENLNESVNM